MTKKDNNFIDPLDTTAGPNYNSPPKQKRSYNYDYDDDDDDYDDDDYYDDDDDDYELDIPGYDDDSNDWPDDTIDTKETISDDIDFGPNAGIGACFDDGPELGSEEIALNREYIISASAKAFTSAIQSANLSMGCKRAFQQVVDANFNKDIFLAYIQNPAVAKLNLKLALSHVALSCIPHDIYQPEFVQLKTNILEAYPFIISRGIGGRERYYQGLHRSESRSGESVDAFQPEKHQETKQKTGWRNILKR